LDLLHSKLVTFSGGMSGAAGKLRSIKSGEWVGGGGNAFRGLISDQPPKFDTAGTSFSRAHVALSSYTRVLRDAQADAVKAVHLHGQGESATSTWNSHVTSYNTAVHTAKQNAAPGKDPAPVSMPRPAATDPGASQKAAAQQLLSDARGRVDSEAKRLHGEVHSAADDAPKKPGLLHRALHAIGGVFTFAGHAVEGIGEGVWGMAKGVWALTGAAVTNPKQFAQSWKGIGTLVDVFQPSKMGQAWKAFGKGFVNWDEWSKDPGRAFGETLANVGALALGGESLVGDAGEAGEAGIAGEAGDASLAADAGDAGTAGDTSLAGDSDLTGSGADTTLTEADQSALSFYTGSAYRGMNNMLRGEGHFRPEDRTYLQEHADAVSTALAKLPDHPGTTFRGVDYSNDVLDGYQPGSVITHHAFTSTSTDLRVATDSFDGNTLLTITGKSGKDVDALSSNSGEAEILYDKGTEFQVVSKEWDPTLGKWHIDLEEVGK
jgi:hypothetical protein